MGRFPHSHIVKTILAGGGFNWTLVDAEHGQITDKDYYEVSPRVFQYKSSCNQSKSVKSESALTES